ncbi:MAG: leucine-rich repeat domain-containing protein [Clostridiales bacterium]|nr:leucine-rich repeat domain-containing protein [Clostridiales bacterium]
MKKKLLITLLSLVCIMCLSFGLAACGDRSSESSHTHNYQWVDNGDGTHKQHCPNSGCNAPYINSGNHVWGANDKCECGAIKPPEGHTHNYQWVDNGDGTHKQHCQNSDCNAPDINSGSHVWGANDRCVCGANKPVDDHTHNYQWVDNGDGTHKQHCSNSGCDTPDINSGSHVWGANDKCECGATKPVPATQGLAYDFDSIGQVYTLTGLGEATDTDIIIPDTYEGYPVKYIGQSAFEGTAITSVKFGKNVLTVETSAFKDCTKLKNVDINLRCNTFFYSCFAGCTALERIELPKYSSYNYITVMSGMFKDCTALQYADLGKALTIDGNFFNGCSALQTVIADNMTSFIGYDDMFAGCTNLATFNIPDKVKRVSASWFQDTKLLTQSNNIKYVGTWAVGFVDDEQATSTLSFRSGTTGIDAYSFANDNVTDVYLPSTLKHIYGQFGSMKNIANFHLTDLSAYLRLEVSEYGLVSSLESKPYRMYLNGTELTNLVIPTTITEIPAGAFYNCQSIQTVNIHSNVTEIGRNAFKYCKKIAYTEYKNGKYIGEIGGAVVLFGLTNKAATSFEFAPNTVVISESAFASSSIQSITIPDSVKVIGTSAFEGCKSLTSVTLPSGLTEIAECMFRWCTSLSDITVPDSVTVVRGGAFDQCSSLTKLPFGPNSKLERIDNAYVYNTYNQYGAFSNSGLQQISLPTTLTYIGSYAFKNCKNFNELTIGSTVTYIGHHSFENCKMITLVINGTSNTEIGANAFSSCSQLESADIKVRFINTSAFSSCRALRDLTLHEGLIQLAYSVFSNCTSLYTVTLPSTLLYIQKDTFNYCDKLVEVQNLSDVNITKDEIKSMRLLRKAATPSAIFKEDGFVFFRDAEEGKTYLLLYEGSETEVTLPVIDGGYELFKSALTSCAFTKVTIPQGVTVIADMAFGSCKSLSELHISADVQSISSSAFNNCDNLTTIEVDENNAFYSVIDGIMYDKAVTDILWTSPTLSGRVVIPETVLIICESDFEEKDQITEVVLKGVTEIEWFAFYGCDKLESIVLPNTITFIGESAFEECTELRYVYYTGTAEDWATIEIEDFALPDDAVIYYFSEEEPQSAGNYWHYDGNGNPVVWQAAN